MRGYAWEWGRMSTPYHAKLWAMELERRAEVGSSETFARALSDAKVDLNPHQVEAAMFAVRSPLAAGGRTWGQAAPYEVTRLKVAEGREFRSA
jgi:hypothetical protein